MRRAQGNGRFADRVGRGGVCLSDRCQNATDQEFAKTNIGGGRCISQMESDVCWHVDALNGQELELAYVGRGNTLSYKRVKEQPPGETGKT